MRVPLSGHRSSRRGIVAVVMAICLVLLLTVVAMTADGGILLADRRLAQATADAAALSAAIDIFENWATYQDTADEGHDAGGTARSAAQDVISSAGYTSTNSETTIRISPENYAGGAQAGTPLPRGYVEVTIRPIRGRLFSAIFGSGQLNVRARGVARGGWLFAPPVWVGHPTSGSALWFPNSALGNITIGSTVSDLNPHGGRVIVNSNSATAAINEVPTGTISATDFFFTGGHLGTFTGTMHSGARPVPDPLRHIPEVPPPATSHSRVQYTSGSQTLNPGRYVGGIAVGNALSTANLTLNPGIYYMEGTGASGGFSFLGSGTLSGSGVLIYNEPKASTQNINITGRGTIVLSPPTSGLYKGITFFQQRSATNPISLNHSAQLGVQYFNITGALYALNSTVTVTRKPGDLSAGSQFIVNRLIITGTGDITIPGNYVRQRLVGGVE